MAIKRKVLVDEAAPSLSAAVPQHNAEAVGNPSYGSAICVTEGVTHRIVTDFFSGSAPNITKFVTQSEVIAVSESVKTGSGGFFLELEKSAWYTAVDPPAFKDSPTEHHLYYPSFGCKLRSGICLRSCGHNYVELSWSSI